MLKFDEKKQIESVRGALALRDRIEQEVDKAWLERKTVVECMYAGAKNASVTIGYSGAW